MPRYKVIDFIQPNKCISFIKESHFRLIPNFNWEYGWGNGYCSIGPRHKLYKVGYDFIDTIDVHGGLTYANLEDSRWVLGYDCCHYGDTIYTCSKQFVEEETLRLKEQLENYK